MDRVLPIVTNQKAVTIAALAQTITYDEDITKTVAMEAVQNGTSLASDDTLAAVTLTANALTVPEGNTITPLQAPPRSSRR